MAIASAYATEKPSVASPSTAVTGSRGTDSRCAYAAAGVDERRHDRQRHHDRTRDPTTASSRKRFSGITGTRAPGSTSRERTP